MATTIRFPIGTSHGPSPCAQPSTSCASSTPVPCSPPIGARSTGEAKSKTPRTSQELEREKRLAREHRATDRLHHAAPSSKALFVAAAERNHHLGVLARGLIALLNAHGPVALERAIAAALQSDAAHLGGVRHFIDQHRKESDKPPPLALDLPDDPRLRTLSVRPHDLADYDRLNDESDSGRGRKSP